MRNLIWATPSGRDGVGVRLGRVLHWLSAAFAVILFLAVPMAFGPYLGAFAGGLLIATAILLAGRALRYVFSGE